MRAKFQKEVIDRSLSDIKVEFDSEFDRNFVRKSFFDEQTWPGCKEDDGKGSLLCTLSTRQLFIDVSHINFVELNSQIAVQVQISASMVRLLTNIVD